MHSPTEQRPSFIPAAVILALVLAVPRLAAQSVSVDPQIDWAELQDPAIVLPPIVYQWPDSLPRLWQTALEHQEADLQREAANSITLAHGLGMPTPSGL